MSNDPLAQIELEESRKSPNKEKKLPVMEIFGPTVQGEGAMIGVRTSFVRFGLCDYRCTMCDSMHAVDPKRVHANAEWLVTEEILQRLREVHHSEDRNLNCEWVTLSGGNPAMHNLGDLIINLQTLGIKVAIETQGTLNPDWLGLCDVITCSPKSPGMGEKFEEDKFLQFVTKWKNHKGFNVKVVVFSMLDIEWTRTINDIMKSFGLEDSMYLSLGNPWPPGLDEPIASDEELKISLLNEYRALTEDLLQISDLSNVKFLPQLHVLTWANKQGV